MKRRARTHTHTHFENSNSNWYHPGDSIDSIERKWNKYQIIRFLPCMACIGHSLSVHITQMNRWEKESRAAQLRANKKWFCGTAGISVCLKKKNTAMKAHAIQALTNVIMLSFAAKDTISTDSSAFCFVSHCSCSHLSTGTMSTVKRTMNKEWMTAQLKLSLPPRSERRDNHNGVRHSFGPCKFRCFANVECWNVRMPLSCIVVFFFCYDQYDQFAKNWISM